MNRKKKWKSFFKASSPPPSRDIIFIIFFSFKSAFFMLSKRWFERNKKRQVSFVHRNHWKKSRKRNFFPVLFSLVIIFFVTCLKAQISAYWRKLKFFSFSLLYEEVRSVFEFLKNSKRKHDNLKFFVVYERREIFINFFVLFNSSQNCVENHPPELLYKV